MLISSKKDNILKHLINMRRQDKLSTCSDDFNLSKLSTYPYRGQVDNLDEYFIGSSNVNS